MIRFISQERSAMEHVNRGLKQKLVLFEQIKGRANESDWKKRFSHIEQLVAEGSWSEAQHEFNEFTNDLDKEGKAIDESFELYEFATGEWRALRQKCEQSGIKIQDPDRMECERIMALAEERLGEGSLEACLTHLGEVDAMMEKIRRRL